MIPKRARPEDATLGGWLESVLASGRVVHLDREPRGEGTFPKEVVRCRTDDGRERVLFCKYAARRGASFGHRGGVGYEAQVYRNILQSSASSTPAFVGSGGDEASGQWLILEFLEGAARLAQQPARMPAAAAWLGRFHGLNAQRISDPELGFLTVYDPAYYLGWAERTLSLAANRREAVPWLPRLCNVFADVVIALLDAEQTVIHGEYTVKNVMVDGTCIRPTDWETAAIAPGEIDLVCLIDMWDPELAQACTDAYITARWPAGAPVDFAERLLAAELYLHFRWLGDGPGTIMGKERIVRFGRLETLATQLGLMS